MLSKLENNISDENCNHVREEQLPGLAGRSPYIDTEVDTINITRACADLEEDPALHTCPLVL